MLQIIVILFLVLMMGFDLGRKWERMEWDGSFDESEEIETPYINCGWKSPKDGTCSHPSNATPECHQFICPILPIDK